jgi:PPM family protein phosphatase
MDEVPLLFSNASDTGRVRSANEDAFAYVRVGERHLFVVADGMGGEKGGRVASTTAVAQVRAVFEGAEGTAPPEILADGIRAANEACLVRQAEDPELAQMGTTIDLLLVEGDRAWWGHVGDSRIYGIAEGRASRLTRDHTRVQQLVEDGFLDPAEAAEHPQRNVLSRVVGRERDCHPDVTPEPVPVAPGDAFLLCSDGLTDVVTDEEIGRIVSRCDPGRACRQLIRLALSRGAPDNVTVQVVFRGQPRSAWERMKTLVPVVAPGPVAPESPLRKRRWRLAAVAGLSLFLLAGLVSAVLWLAAGRAKGLPTPTRNAGPRGGQATPTDPKPATRAEASQAVKPAGTP